MKAFRTALGTELYSKFTMHLQVILDGQDSTRASFSMSDLSDLSDSDKKIAINVLGVDIPDSINVSNQSFIF